MGDFFSLKIRVSVSQLLYRTINHFFTFLLFYFFSSVHNPIKVKMDTDDDLDFCSIFTNDSNNNSNDYFNCA